MFEKTLKNVQEDSEECSRRDFGESKFRFIL